MAQALIRVTTTGDHYAETGDIITLDDVTGTTEANGVWKATKVSNTVVDLQDLLLPTLMCQEVSSHQKTIRCWWVIIPLTRLLDLSLITTTSTPSRCFLR